MLSDIRDIKDKLSLKIITFRAIYQAVLTLLDENPGHPTPSRLHGDEFSCTSCFDKNEKGYNISRISLTCIIVAYVLDDYSSAFEFVEICRKHQSHIATVYSYPQLLFYDGLVSLELARNKTGIEKITLVQRAQENISKLTHFTANAPCNYLNKMYFLNAELAVVFGDNNKAISNYEETIKLSQKHLFVHEEAMSCERFALLYHSMQASSEASKYFIKAYKCYEKWGAVKKMKQLKSKYPSYINDDTLNVRVSFASTGMEISNTQDIVSMVSELTSSTSSVTHKNKRGKYA